MSMLLRFDPFRELDRVIQKTEQLTRSGDADGRVPSR